MKPPVRTELCVDQASLHSLLRLALAIPGTEQGPDWAVLLARAERERLVAVAWQRSADEIRRHAPAPISSAWQKRAIVSGLVSDKQLEVLAETVTTLRTNGMSPVVLKGFPLAKRVYGDHTVRPVLDSDLYIPSGERSTASNALASVGWRCTSGCAPEEERFERTVGPHTFVLEVHSSALDDALLDHVHFPVEQQLTRVGAYDLPAHSGRFVPAYLATHLAKHHEKPLLWAVDFFLLWRRLSEAERRDATSAAREVGLGRHLAWALDLCADIAACDMTATDAAPALQRIERTLTVHGDARRLVRLVSLSASPKAALAVVAGRIWPAAWRQGWRQAPKYFVHRIVTWLYRHLVFETPSVVSAAVHESAIALTEGESEQCLLAALQNQRAAWVWPPDGSMEPAVPRYAAVRVVPLNGRGLERGDVVVLAMPSGGCGLRRVRSLGRDRVRLEADTSHRAGVITLRASIIARCDLVDVDGTRTAIEQRPHGTFALLRSCLRGAGWRAAPAGRLMYVYDFKSTPEKMPDTSVRFEELTRDEIRVRAASLNAGGQEVPSPNVGDSGCVVGTLSGRQVYHVWFVRGDAARLRDLPDTWRPRGDVLFLHGGYTEPEFRSRGIHSAALRWLLARERDSGTEHAIGVVDTDNGPALRAVESVGFRAVGRVP